jgi:hypothetical protein
MNPEVTGGLPMKMWVFLLAGLVVVSATLSQAKSQNPLFASPHLDPALVSRIDVFVVDPSNDAANDRERIGGAKSGKPRIRWGEV